MNKADLLAKTKTELLKTAQRLGLRGVSTLKKEELAERIHEAQRRSKGAAVRKPMSVSVAAGVDSDLIKRRAVRKRAGMVEAEAVATGKSRRTRSARRPKAAQTPKPAVVEGDDIIPPSDELSAHKFDVTPDRLPPRQVFQEEHLG